MNRSIVFIFLIAVMCLFFYSCIVGARGINKAPLIWDSETIAQLGKDDVSIDASKRIISEANKCCEKAPVVVTNKRKTFAPDLHYYCSTGTYWWPDPKNPGKYMVKDGVANPEVKQFDHPQRYELAERCQYLSMAFYITHDKKYYKKFIEQIRAWFVDVETYMYPNFKYAQVIPGEDDNKGRSTGMIEAYSFNTVIESVRLVNGVKSIDRQTMKALKRWFSEFAEWADKGEFGEVLHNADNNIGLAYDVTLINMYLFVDNESRAKEITDEFEERRINRQIMTDGRQPAELKRTRAFSYSIYNLTHLLDFCFLARYWYPNYYQEHRERIDAAFEYLRQNIDNPDQFQFKQDSSWETCRIEYKQLEEKFNLLLNKVYESTSN